MQGMRRIRALNHVCLYNYFLPFLLLNICFMLEVFLSRVWTCFRLLSSKMENCWLSDAFFSVPDDPDDPGVFLIRD